MTRARSLAELAAPRGMKRPWLYASQVGLMAALVAVMCGDLTGTCLLLPAATLFAWEIGRASCRERVSSPV